MGGDGGLPWFLAPGLALLAGLMALAPLGAQVLERRVIFIDLAVAQGAAAAALWSAAWVDHPDLATTQAVAAAGALACAGLVAGLARRWPDQREALIGLVYVAGASVALLGARLDPHGGERLVQLLAADVLWAGWPQVGLLGTAAAVVVLMQRGWPARLAQDAWFYPLFALVASLAVPVLGLWVVFTGLIAPALWQRAGLAPPAAGAVALAAAGTGLGASWWWDAPSGALVALALALCGLLAALQTGRAAAARR